MDAICPHDSEMTRVVWLIAARIRLWYSDHPSRSVDLRKEQEAGAGLGRRAVHEHPRM